MTRHLELNVDRLTVHAAEDLDAGELAAALTDALRASFTAAAAPRGAAFTRHHDISLHARPGAPAIADAVALALAGLARGEGSAGDAERCAHDPLAGARAAGKFRP